MRLILFIALLLIQQVVFSQQNTTSLKGKVLNAETRKTISRVRISNITHKNGLFSDSTGFFTIELSSNDTLIISAIGYNPKQIVIHDLLIGRNCMITVELEPVIYQMNEISISAVKSYYQFKSEIINSVIPCKENDNWGLPKAKPGPPALLNEKVLRSFKFARNSPVSFLYYNLNKQEQSKRKVFNAEANDKQVHLIEEKFNRQKVELWTSLKGDTLTNFILFCSFSNSYLLEASEYEIMISVKEKLTQFLPLKAASSN